MGSRAAGVGVDLLRQLRPELRRQVVTHAVDQAQPRPRDRPRRRLPGRGADERVSPPVDDDRRHVERAQTPCPIAGGVDRLRPHIKTNKLPEVVRMQIDQGIIRFKCATIAEAEVAAMCAAPDVLLAYQPVGPNVQRFVQLVKKFPGTKFSALVDDEGAILALSRAASAAHATTNG